MVALHAIDRLSIHALGALLERLDGVPLRILLWDGRAFGSSAGRALATVRLADRGALLRLLYDPEIEFGELYREGRLSVEGDLVGLLRAAFAKHVQYGLARKLVPQRLLWGVSRNDERTARANAVHHYDVGNDFYQLWLDERMVYTCAYFPRPEVGLEEAQLAKLEHVCRKLALRPGETVIEAGCGWGALALHMARWYGVRVRAWNVSREQLAFAREQAEKEGLQDRVGFVEDDYRNISGRCDAFVSVGMLEHVGKAHYAELRSVMDRCLGPEGRGLIHSIGRTRAGRLSRWIERRIFPNAYPPTLGEMMQLFEPDFSVLDVENLRRHYALTLRHWLARFEAHRARAIELVGLERARTWHLYLAGSIAAFEAGSLELFQVLYTRKENSRFPWTRARLYGGGDDGFGDAAIG
ncbi:MAG: class I SAM-dependent methyltransferase [Gammaproteobacteria bacterium]